MPGCSFLLHGPLASQRASPCSSHADISLRTRAFSFFHLSYFTLPAGLPKGCNGIGVACQGPEGTTSPSWSCPPPRGSPHPAQGPGLHVTPPGQSGPAPVTPQWGLSSASHSCALPGHGPCRTRPPCRAMSCPSLGPALLPTALAVHPGLCLTPVPLPGPDPDPSCGLMFWPHPEISLGSWFPSPRGAAGPHCP